MAGHWIGAAVLLVVGVAGAWLGRSLPLGGVRNPGPGFFPFWISVTIVVLALLSLGSLAARGVRWAAPIHWPPRGAWSRIATSLVLFTGYAFILEALGYVLATSLLIGLFVKLVFARSFRSSALLTATAILASYALFVWILGVRLPVPGWW